MAAIIVLDSSDEEVEPVTKPKQKSPIIISTPSKSTKDCKLKRTTTEMALKLKKPEWYTFQNSHTVEKSPAADRIKKPTPNATQNGRPPDNIVTIVEETKCAIAQSSKQLESVADRVTKEKPQSGSSPGGRSCGTPAAECSSTKPASRSSTPQQTAPKRKLSDSSDPSSEKSVKRIRPIQISEKVDHSWVASQSPVIAIDEDDKPPDSTAQVDDKSSPSPKVDIPEVDSKSPSTPPAESQQPINPIFAALLDACRAADSSPDMEQIIKNKLLKYYHDVHPDFVASKGFCKTVKAVTAQIQNSPNLVYLNLKTIVEELQIRRKSKDTVMSNEEVTTTGSKKKDRQVRRLSKALYIVTKKIAKLEESDADLDDDNSAYLKCERFKKRACEIYEMICDLTGESKHAHRLVKKPITFKGSPYPEFNRTLQSFVNRTNSFPDFYDVYRCLEHCNNRYCFGLKNDEMRRIAQDAFLKIGKSLQNRRKTDLYETVSHFAGCNVDPAESDPTLDAKLKENQKFHAKISTLIDRFAKEQEVAASENEKNKTKSQASGAETNSGNAIGKMEEEDTKPCTSGDDLTKNPTKNENHPIIVENGESSPKIQSENNQSTSTAKKSDNTPAAAVPSPAPVEEIIISDGEDS